MFIPDPGSRFLPILDPGSLIPDLGSRIPDPKTATKRGVKFFVVVILVSTNFTKLQIILFFSAEEKIWSNFRKIRELFTQKIVTKHGGLGSGIKGSKKAPDPGSGSATLLSTLLYTEIQ